MSRCAFQRIAFAGAVLFGSQFLAQAQVTTAFQSAVTSGIVGLASSETAQLNVLNLQEPGTTASATAAACPVTLEFVNVSGAVVGTPLQKSIAPGQAVSAPYALPSVTSPRTEIRAVVITQTVSAAAGSTVIPVSPTCNLLPSLEIVDTSGGTTHVFTTDFRAMTPSGPQPLSAAPATAK
jgi:hypothetical protein